MRFVKRPKKTATVMAAFIAAAAAVYALWLLFVGQQVITVIEGSTVGEIGYSPNPSAVFPFTGALFLLVGLWRQQQVLSWVGFLILAAFSALFVFGIGGFFVFPSIAILAMLLISKFAKNQ